SEVTVTMTKRTPVVLLSTLGTNLGQEETSDNIKTQVKGLLPFLRTFANNMGYNDDCTIFWGGKMTPLKCIPNTSEIHVFHSDLEEKAGMFQKLVETLNKEKVETLMIENMEVVSKLKEQLSKLDLCYTLSGHGAHFATTFTTFSIFNSLDCHVPKGLKMKLSAIVSG
ncbi:hypothetical protein ACJX0J_028489, partial [Zea mays]